MSFLEEIARTPNLQNAGQIGLNALRAQDRRHIRPDDPSRLTGSVDVDTALRESAPNAHRWDYAIGFQHANRGEETIYWVETHTGSDAEIKIVCAKLEWLKGWLHGDGHRLSRFERDIVWAASGATHFTRGSRQVTKLAQKGLRYVGSCGLRIKDERP